MGVFPRIGGLNDLWTFEATFHYINQFIDEIANCWNDGTETAIRYDLLWWRQLNFPSQSWLTLFFRNNIFWRNIQKMNIFGNFIILQITAGLDPQGGRRNTIFRIIYAMLFGLFYLFTSIFITKNLRSNIDAALYDVSIINGNTAFVLTYIYLVIYRKQFYSLLEDMEDIVQQSL